jgi:hypothetical protein
VADNGAHCFGVRGHDATAHSVARDAHAVTQHGFENFALEVQIMKCRPLACSHPHTRCQSTWLLILPLQAPQYRACTHTRMPYLGSGA